VTTRHLQPKNPIKNSKAKVRLQVELPNLNQHWSINNGKRLS
jgi:hypothetical protein